MTAFQLSLLKSRKARQEYTCPTCEKTIPTGAQYFRVDFQRCYLTCCSRECLKPRLEENGLTVIE